MRPTSLDINLELHLSSIALSASMPAEHRFLRRDETRMLIIDRKTGRTGHHYFYQLPDFLHSGDLVVVNTSATIPGRIHALFNGERLIIHLSTRLTKTTYIIEIRTSLGEPSYQQFQAGDTLYIVNEEKVWTTIIKKKYHAHSRLWIVESDVDLFKIAHQIGTPIRYGYVDNEFELTMYQTLFSKNPGSAEMPSAGRSFTKEVLRNLAYKGVKIRSLVLHTGVSSHEVKTELSEHPVLPEWFFIPSNTSYEVNAAITEGRRVIAVGTTVIRALESALDDKGHVKSGSDWTTKLITPSSPAQIVTGFITGLHESHSSHLALLYSFIAPNFIREAYNQAANSGYLWHEFGDVSLIL